MTAAKEYPSPSAWWRAATDRARMASTATRTPQQVLRELVYERFLARVFAQPDEPWVVNDWVLKGGTALLARVDDARHSKDVDLLNRLGSIDDAVDQLRSALDREVGDPLRFELTKTEYMSDGDGQPGLDRVPLNRMGSPKPSDPCNQVAHLLVTLRRH